MSMRMMAARMASQACARSPILACNGAIGSLMGVWSLMSGRAPPLHEGWRYYGYCIRDWSRVGPAPAGRLHLGMNGPRSHVTAFPCGAVRLVTEVAECAEGAEKA